MQPPIPPKRLLKCEQASKLSLSQQVQYQKVINNLQYIGPSKIRSKRIAHTSELLCCAAFRFRTDRFIGVAHLSQDSRVCLKTQAFMGTWHSICLIPSHLKHSQFTDTCWHCAYARSALPSDYSTLSLSLVARPASSSANSVRLT